MKEVSLEEAQLHLAEIIAAMSPGSEVAIVAGSKAIATIRSTELVQASAPRQLGTLKGSVSYIAPDFDAIPLGFEEALG
jgi:antitoxin (DNA-binding transcriptional repressor) of toxin-antitoxin stability system